MKKVDILVGVGTGGWGLGQETISHLGKIKLLLSLSLNIHLNITKMLWNPVLGSNYGDGFCILSHNAIKGKDFANILSLLRDPCGSWPRWQWLWWNASHWCCKPAPHALAPATRCRKQVTAEGPEAPAQPTPLWLYSTLIHHHCGPCHLWQQIWF